MLKSLLQKIGFPEKNAEVYLACLELGTQPASVIAKKTGLKRPTTYLILEDLLKKGFVSEYAGSNVRYFTAVSPEYILNHIEKKRRDITAHQRQLENLIPHFQALSNPYTLTPKVRFYEGASGIENVMEDTLTSKTDILCVSKIDSWFSTKSLKEYIQLYGRKRVVEKKIPLRGIVIDTPVARNYLSGEYPPDPAFTAIKWFPNDITVFTNEINIYDNKVAICSLGKNELIGIIIESKEISDSQKSLFELAWRAAL